MDNPTSFGEDACGHLYMTGSSTVYRINSTDPPQKICPTRSRCRR